MGDPVNDSTAPGQLVPGSGPVPPAMGDPVNDSTAPGQLVRGSGPVPPAMGEPVNESTIRRAPKSLLHDHLDGGLRPDTILEIADEIGHQLPAADGRGLSEWFVAGARARDINRYLATFEHTVAVMQRPGDLHRVAREAVLDLADDGVVYAETRFAPENHQQGGMSLDEVMESVLAGLDRGISDVESSGRAIDVNLIVCAMRQTDRSTEIAELVTRWRDLDPRVVGFDLAGPETGFPPTDHLAATDLVRRNLVHLTIHASEPPGTELISQALFCGAERIGHGIRLLDDIGTGPEGEPRLGPLARYVLDRQIPLEMAPSCHVQIGAVDSLEDHPLVQWHRMGFVVTVNTDNRLMSEVTVSSETAALARIHGLGWRELGELAVAGVRASFAPLERRREIVDDLMVPAYSALAGGDTDLGR